MTKMLTRRNALLLGAAAGSLTACANATKNPKTTAESIPLDFNNPRWNRDIIVKIQGNTNPERQKIGWYGGRVIGVRPGERNKHLFDFEGFSVARMLPLGDGNYRKVLREVGFYLDKESGAILETFQNPYTGERVNVVPIANDPFNFTYTEFYPDPPSYGGLNAKRPPRRPYLLNWREFGDRVLMNRDINLYYPSALKPDQWPRESPGPMTQVSEMFTYNFPKSQLQDASLSSIEHMGVWNRTTPWLPWMLMDQAPGQCVYVCDFSGRDDWQGIPQKIIDAAAAIDRKYLEAPTEDYGPSLSSLENYKLTETPAPVRD
ncbi:MAG: DUF1838 family protein [Pseudomonadota bacterium]